MVAQTSNGLTRTRSLGLQLTRCRADHADYASLWRLARQRTQPAAGQPALSWGQLLSLPGPVTRASLGQGHLSSVQDTLTWGPQHWGEMIQYRVFYFPIPSLSAGYEIIIKRNTGRNSYEMTKQCVHKFQNYKTKK